MGDMVNKAVKKAIPTTFTLKHDGDGNPPVATLKGPASLFKKQAPDTPKKSPTRKKKTAAEVAMQLGILSNIDRLISQGHSPALARERVARNLALGRKLDITQARAEVDFIAAEHSDSPDGPEGRPAAMDFSTPAQVHIARAQATAAPFIRDRLTHVLRRKNPDDFPDPNFPTEMGLSP